MRHHLTCLRQGFGRQLWQRSPEKVSALDEINWEEITKIYTDGIPRLLRHATAAPKIEVVLWSDSNGGFNFDAYQKFEDGSQKRLGDSETDWGIEFDHLHDTFEEVADTLANEDDFDSLDAAIRQRLRSVAEILNMVAATPDSIGEVA